MEGKMCIMTQADFQALSELRDEMARLIRSSSQAPGREFYFNGLRSGESKVTGEFVEIRVSTEEDVRFFQDHFCSIQEGEITLVPA